MNNQSDSGKIDPQKIKEMKVKEILADGKVISELQEKNPKSHVWIKDKIEPDNLKNKDNKDKDGKIVNGDKKDSKEEKDTPNNKDGNNNNKDKDKDSIPANAGDRGKSDSRNDKKGPIKSPDPPQGTKTGAEDTTRDNAQVVPNNISKGQTCPIKLPTSTNREILSLIIRGIRIIPE